MIRGMTIGIVGNGTVGNAIARSYLEWVDEVRIYDRDKEKSIHDSKVVMDSSIVFICLPEGQVRDFIVRLHPNYREAPMVLKSTVPIGFTKELVKDFGLKNLVHSPEFLTARCAVVDAQMPSRNIIGMPDPDRFSYPTYGGEIVNKLHALYQRRFQGVPIYTMTSCESEAVKLFVNAFFSVKVAFFNEINALATKLGLDWDTVLNGMLSDGRIAHSHTQVPGHDGKYGFGGSCLPKDLRTLIEQFDRYYTPPHVTMAAEIRNDRDRERK